MKPTRGEWAEAFAQQARSDWSMYERLQRDANVSLCHVLHYLQMACEKIAKAYRLRDTETDVDELLTSHVGFLKFVSTYLSSRPMRSMYEGRSAQLQKVRRDALALAREVEKLAPAVDRGASPENAEYPWKSGGHVVVPASYTYPSLSLIGQTAGVTFLKIITKAIEEF